MDCGFRTLLNFVEDKDFKLSLDVDFIFSGADVKEFLQVKDKYIPQFKLDLIKNF